MTDARAALAAVAEEIARLRGGYLEGLPAEFAALAELAGRLEEVGDADVQRDALEQLHHRLHKLAGSGGTFGLRRLTESARRLDQTAKDWLASGIESGGKTARLAFRADIAALPVTLAEVEPAVPAVRPAVAPAAADAIAIRVWLVEDDAPLGAQLTHLLGQFGYEARLFTRVADAEAAAAAATPATRPDVLVMDAMFPAEGINATEAVTRLPALHALGCPLLFISAYGDFQSRVQAARAGAAAFLLKPIDVPRLVDRIQKIFDDRQADPYRVMIVDDDITLSEHYRLVLTSAGMEVEVLNRPETVVDRISAFRPELMLMDIHMPGYSGPELATVIRHHDDWIGLPIVYLSAETDLDEQIRALGSGADDFLTKPISDARLAAAVRVRVSRSRQLADLIAKDSLTGLLKHSRIKEELLTAMARARRNGAPMSAVMIDIDHFKQVNDSYGHPAGDRVLRALSHLLKQRLRRTDSIGRYGGEEFAAILPDCDARTGQRVMEDIRERFAALRFRHDATEFACTLSAGVAQLDGTGGDVLLAADQALYAAKRGGRNRVCVAGDRQ